MIRIRDRYCGSRGTVSHFGYEVEHSGRDKKVDNEVGLYGRAANLSRKRYIHSLVPSILNLTKEDTFLHPSSVGLTSSEATAPRHSSNRNAPLDWHMNGLRGGLRNYVLIATLELYLPISYVMRPTPTICSALDPGTRRHGRVLAAAKDDLPLRSERVWHHLCMCEGLSRRKLKMRVFSKNGYCYLGQ
jgi:hypothetical protein